ncbi:MAG TPA: hypothetical protein VI172_08350 [Candidatus Dormibacteraeota bacterium]|jgi:hypothetical protein
MSDDLIDRLMSGMPESWDGDGSPESAVVEYVRELERRVKALGGNLEKYEGITDARAQFNELAAVHVTAGDDAEWRALVDAWHTYVRTVEAEK